MRAIGWLFAVLGAICTLVYLAGMSLVWTKLLDSMPTPFHAVGLGGLTCIGLWLFLDWGSLSNLGKDQTVGQSFTAGFILLLALSVAVGVNVVGLRYDHRWDLTENKKYSLSQQSIDIVAGLDREVKVIAFFVKGSPEESNFRELLRGYTEQSTLLKVEYHDPYSNPLLAEQEGIQSAAGVAIIRSDVSEQRVEFDFDEENLTNAIIKVTSSRSHTLCVVTGHGEGAADDTYEPTGYGTVFERLKKQNYNVQSIKLLDEPPRPESCEVLVLAGPQSDLVPAELDRVAAYVAAGGRLLALLNPIDAPGTAADMDRYGVKLGNDVIVEGDPYRQVAGGGPTWVVLDSASFSGHPITDKLKGPSILPLARSVSKGPEGAGLTVTELARTTDASWAETDLEQGEGEVAAPDEGIDIVGKVPAMVAVEVADPRAIPLARAPVADPSAVPGLALPTAEPAAVLPTAAGGRVVVIGDSDFASNQFANTGVNQDLLMNAVAWMVDETGQLSIRANEAKKGRLDVGVLQAFAAAAVGLLVVPGLAVMGAVGTYVRRRKL